MKLPNVALFCLFGVLSLPFTVHASEATIALGSLFPESSRQGWGTLNTDKSVSGTPLSVGGKRFEHGLGTHAQSEIVYDLEEMSVKAFTAMVGADDALKDHPDVKKASMVFQVYVDGVSKFDSGVMHIGDQAKPVNVDLTGAKILKLVVTDAGDGVSCDHADWAEAVLVGKRSEVGGQRSEAKYEVRAKGISLRLGKSGAIVDVRVGDGGVTWPVSGETRLKGFRADDEVKVTSSCFRDKVTFSSRQKDSQGRTCIVINRFTPDNDAILWEVEITSPDAFWTTPIVSSLQCDKPEEKLIWTAWGSPDFSGTQLTPELTARVQASKASVSGSWSDPLVPVGFLNRNWHYGNTAQVCPVGGDYIVSPLFTMLEPSSDTGLSLVLSPDDTLLAMDLNVSSTGQVMYSRSNHRLGGGKTVNFTMHLVPHEASWRGGLRFLTNRYPQYFEAPNPRAHKVAGCGAYSICEAPIDVAKFKQMAFGFNWKLSDDFPYMGMFLPPVKSADEKWTRSCGEPCPPGKGRETCTRQMNDYARYMKTNGFAVLSYFNVTEYGKNVNPRQGELPPGKAADPDLWKDGSAYMKTKLPNAWLKVAADKHSEFGSIGLAGGSKGLMSNCYGAAIVDPGDPDYINFICEQAARNIKWLPDTDGICIDRTDWLRFYNITADDGVSWPDGRAARSLYRSWADLMAQMGPLMHKADKVIFCNLMAMRLELSRELDGIYTEFGQSGNALNGSALIGIRKPVVAWTYNETLNEPGPDAFMQRHLHLGAFPTAPYPYNNHCINPSPSADRLYLDYGPLLEAMRGKKWVLVPHCAETITPGVKVNLFEIPGGYAMPVTFGGTNLTAEASVRNVKGLKSAKCEVIHPGEEKPVMLTPVFKDEVLALSVPLKRSCAMVKLMIQ